MELTWNDLSGPATRWWGLHALVAMRRDHHGTIAVQQTFGDLLPQQIVNERSVDVFDPELPTAVALLWWRWLMASQPQVQQRAAAEIDACLAGQPPGADAVQALAWLTATLKDAMRLFPPVAAVMTRRLTREIQRGGVRLPARTVVRVRPWLLQRFRLSTLTDTPPRPLLAVTPRPVGGLRLRLEARQ